VKKTDVDRKGISSIFPPALREMANRICDLPGVEEIRIRRNCPVIVYAGGAEYWISKNGRRVFSLEEAYHCSGEDLEQMLSFLCRQSVYAYEEELRQGFVTIPGGHRVGIAGQVIREKGKVKNIRYISGMNIRIAGMVNGAADSLLPYLYENGVFCNTLVLSPPGCGKTTLLRDLIRQISNGNPFAPGQTVGVVDERSELSGGYLGEAFLDLGIRTDVLDRCPKSEGMMMLVRSMNPSVLAVDELGGEEDVTALKTALYCGCKILATVHGNDLSDIDRKPSLRHLQEEKAFCRILRLYKKDGIFSSEIYNGEGRLMDRKRLVRRDEAQ